MGCSVSLEIRNIIQKSLAKRLSKFYNKVRALLDEE